MDDLDQELGADLVACEEAQDADKDDDDLFSDPSDLCEDELVEDDWVFGLLPWLLAWAFSILDDSIDQVPELAAEPELGAVRIVPGQLSIARNAKALLELKIWDPTGLPLDPASRPGLSVDWTASAGVIADATLATIVYTAPAATGDVQIVVRVTSGAQTRTDAIKLSVEETGTTMLAGNGEDILRVGPLVAGGDPSPPHFIHLNVGLQEMGVATPPPCTHDTIFALVGHATPEDDLTPCSGSFSPRLTVYSRGRSALFEPTQAFAAVPPPAICAIGAVGFPCPVFSHNTPTRANAVTVNDDGIPKGLDQWSVAAFEAPDRRRVPVRLKYDVPDDFVLDKHGPFPETVEEHLKAWGEEVLEVASNVLDRSRAGLVLEAVFHDTSRKDSYGLPADPAFAPDVVCHTEAGLTKRVPHLDEAYLNIVVVEQVVEPWGAGYSCLQHDDVVGRVIAVEFAAADAGWVVAHEVGHALSLDQLPDYGHVNDRFDLFDKGNAMAISFRPSISDRDYTFTLGQVFRMNSHPDSWLQHADLPADAADPPSETECQVWVSDADNASKITVFESGACPPVQLVPYRYPGYGN